MTVEEIKAVLEDPINIAIILGTIVLVISGLGIVIYRARRHRRW